MAYTLAKVKTFRGMEGHGLNATLMHNGEAVAFILDEGNGGEVRFDFRNPGQTRRSFEATTRADAEREESEFLSHCRFWYAESGQKAKDEKEYGTDHPFDRDGFLMEVWVNHHIDEALNKRRLDRIAKTKTLFRLRGDDADAWRTVSAPYSEGVQKFLNTKYGDKVVAIYGRQS